MGTYSAISGYHLMYSSTDIFSTIFWQFSDTILYNSTQGQYSHELRMSTIIGSLVAFLFLVWDSFL